MLKNLLLIVLLIMILKNWVTRILLAIFFIIFSISSQAQLSLFEQDTVNAIYLTIPADSFAKLYALDGKYYMANMQYTNTFATDTIDSVAIRFRGNTSLAALKKSIKISFNTYDSTKRYKGVRKLNLIGNHNDPTMIREKLFYDCWKKFGLPKRRMSFVNVYINNLYFGLYTNVEEIDAEWLQDANALDNSNMYKCSWGADLSYLGPGQAAYKTASSSGDKTYDLQTNETIDDYSDLVNFITTINNSSTTNYLTYLDTIFDYQSFLKSLALDVASGNWDDYAYNKNNYILYHDSATKKFRYVTIDADNTFGVDWSGIDWTMRDPYLWYNQTEARPLAKRILDNAQGKALFTKYLDTVFNYIAHPDTLFPVIDKYKLLIAPFAALDSFRTLDYGYTLAAFNDGFITTIDAHTPYGIKPFLEKRRQAYLTLGVDELLHSIQEIYPNPCYQTVFINRPANFSTNYSVAMINYLGEIVETKNVNNGLDKLDVSALQDGIYFIQLTDANGKKYSSKILKK